MWMNCKKCGNNNPEGAFFCYSCGALLDQIEEKREQVEHDRKKSRQIMTMSLLFVLAIGLILMFLLPDTKSPSNTDKSRKPEIRLLDE